MVAKCDLASGDGVGGDEENVGDAATEEECIEMVKLRPFCSTGAAVNGATYANGGNACYAECGATGANDDSDYKTCIFPGKKYQYIIYIHIYIIYVVILWCYH